MLREHARSMPLRTTRSEKLSVARQRRWDGATRRAEERSGLQTAGRLPLYPSPTTCERERRRSPSLPCRTPTTTDASSQPTHCHYISDASIKGLLFYIKSAWSPHSLIPNPIRYWPSHAVGFVRKHSEEDR